MKHKRSPTLKKGEVEWAKKKTGDIPSAALKIEELFGDAQEISILDNIVLNEQLKKLAKLLSSSLKMANKTVIGRLTQKFDNSFVFLRDHRGVHRVARYWGF